MPIFKVTGKIAYEEFCECEYCKGHPYNADVNRTLEADDKYDAIDRALDDEIVDRGLDDAEWAGEPTVIETAEDIRMRMMGAPVLPGFEGM